MFNWPKLPTVRYCQHLVIIFRYTIFLRSTLTKNRESSKHEKKKKKYQRTGKEAILSNFSIKVTILHKLKNKRRKNLSKYPDT